MPKIRKFNETNFGNILLIEVGKHSFYKYKEKEIEINDKVILYLWRRFKNDHQIVPLIQAKNKD